MTQKYSDQFAGYLKELGYTHCFFVAGGNIMHILESVSKFFECIPVVHEVSAGIATEFFNESSDGTKKAFALVTAGPGVTNIVTAMAGAYLESRELLVIGGQVKSSDLRTPGLRQKGIQEVDGIAIVKSVCVDTLQITKPLTRSQITKTILAGSAQRKGPVFIEFCLDAQGAPAIEDSTSAATLPAMPSDNQTIDNLFKELIIAKRPVLLIGGGVSRKFAKAVSEKLSNLQIPIMTTWNGADRLPFSAPSYFGRPNTWGQRSSNIIMQQSDLLMAVGTRLGLQQTGFNWQGFIPNGKVAQVEIDTYELEKTNPVLDYSICHDADDFLAKLIETLDSVENAEWDEWRKFSQKVRSLIPLSDPKNLHKEGFIDPYDFVQKLSKHINPSDSYVPSSSGGSETVAMQAFLQPADTTVITSKGLASMGYGLAGAIGCALQSRARVIHMEGDGGFAQNLQELGTISNQKLPIKMFIICNDGYASIRMTQKSYFNGNYIGCDSNTGLGLPNWEKLFTAYEIPVFELDPANPFSQEVLAAMNGQGPAAFLVPVDPEQTYYPKITSSVTSDGNIVSNPLHLMTPPLDKEIHDQVFQYIEV
jgi:acetolactate synthase-1/2/3 large subunit